MTTSKESLAKVTACLAPEEPNIYSTRLIDTACAP